MDLKFYIKTFGCQMNENDSEAIKGILKAKGFIPTDVLEEADIIIVNTCAVRKKAEDKFYGKLGEINRLKRRRKEIIVGVGGCIAEKEKEKLLENKIVNFVFGTRSISRIDSLIDEALKGKRFVYMEDHIDELNSYFPRLRDSNHHAWVTIIYGCNKFCSYCIVPYTRGREKSRPMHDILREVKNLATQGYIEITFLGQNVDSYGKDLKDGSSLAGLLREAEKISGIERLWFLTSYPKDFSDELIEVIARSNKIAKCIHLPIQSGSNKILKLMNRGYTREFYLDLIRRIRNTIQDVSVSTDVIVGFPKETEEDFEETLKLIKDVRFERVNLAIYSPREGTYAAKHFSDEIPHKEKSKRLQTILELQKRINYEINQNYLNKEVEVIIEAKVRKHQKLLYGRTINNKIIIFEGPEDRVGTKVIVKINKITAGPLYGEIINQEVKV